MKDTKISLFKKYKKRSLLSKINDIILLTTLLLIFVAIIFCIVYGAKGEFNISNSYILDLFLLPILGFMTFSGVISVVASNNKSPIMLLIFSTIATIFKLMYPIAQITTGSEVVNSTVLFGQSISFFLLGVQVYFWIKWNKQTDEGKFITESFKGKRSKYSLIIILSVFLIMFSISYYLNKGNFWWIIIDVLQSMIFLIATTLMAFGNILCFPFFIISDLSWMIYTINSIINTDSGFMLVMAIFTSFEVIAYTLLAITGFFQWFIDDYKFVDGKIISKERKTNIKKIKSQE